MARGVAREVLWWTSVLESKPKKVRGRGDLETRAGMSFFEGGGGRSGTPMDILPSLF